MTEMHGPISSDQWLHEVFASKAARDGRVVRRKLRDIDKFIGRDRFALEIERRGFHAVENAGQIVVFCNQEPVRTFR